MDFSWSIKLIVIFVGIHISIVISFNLRSECCGVVLGSPATPPPDSLVGMTHWWVEYAIQEPGLYAMGWGAFAIKDAKRGVVGCGER